MVSNKELRFDEIGYWSEIKLDIVKKHAAAYTSILSKRTKPAFTFSHIDAFSGAGIHISKQTGDFVPGSPLNALLIQPPFNHYYLVDLDSAKIEHLKGLVGERKNVELFIGDCNHLLLHDLFPKSPLPVISARSVCSIPTACICNGR